MSDTIDEEIRTSAREMKPHAQSRGSTSPRCAFVFGPLVKITGRTITQLSFFSRR
jgi:hypothetical protein